MVVTEIEFRKIAVQVLFGTVLIDATHTSLEDREHVLNGVGVDNATGIFTG